MGSFLSSTDMKTGSPAFGGPESAFGLYASGQIARRLGLPWRSGGGTLTASPAVDFQAGYEAMNTLQAAFLAGANVCWQSAGWLEGGLVTSLREVRGRLSSCSTCCCHQFTPVEIDEVGARLRRPRRGRATAATSSAPSTRWSASATASGGPTVATTDEPRPLDEGRQLADARTRAGRRWRELLETYERPPLDEAIEEELVEFVERRAVELGDPVSVA